MTVFARSLCLLVALLGYLAVPGRADDGVTLKWKFKPQQASHYTTAVDLKSVGKQGSREPQESSARQTINMTWTVDSVDDDGNANITQQIDRVRMQSSEQGHQTTFDSKDKDAPDDVDVIHQPVHLVISSQGKVIDVRPSEKMAEKLKQAPGPMAAMFSRESLKETVKMSTLEFPDKPLTKGTTWEQQSTINVPMSGRMTQTISYRYDGTEERDGQTLDKISATAKVSPAGDQGASQRPTIKDQKLNGVIWFDRKLGRIHELQMTTKVVREGTIGNNKLEETLTTKTHTRLVAESDAANASQ
jgi:hypothetical protein